MNINEKKFNIITIILFVILFFTLFVTKIIEVWMVSLLIIPFVVCTYIYVKKRSILSIYKKEVVFLMLIISAVYVMLFYVLGIKFGFYSNVYTTNILVTLFKYILPIAVIIIGVEYIRSIMLQQNKKHISAMVFGISVFSEIIVYMCLKNTSQFEGFVNLIGMAIIPAISSNILYQYISKNYGMHPNLVFRLITGLYVFILPVLPNIVDLLMAFLSLLLPLLIYGFIKTLYEKKKMVVSLKTRRIENVFYAFAILIMAFVVMLVSNQFRYQFIVVGSESMTGELNKGDAVVYEDYISQNIQEGQVIVFKVDKQLIIHRVVKIERVDNVNRYYTKGDANDYIDSGYILEEQIIGVAHFKIPYIGYPTLWLKEIFK